MPNTWLRFNYLDPIRVSGRIEPCHFLRAIRSDGQQYEAHMCTDGTNLAEIRRDLRKCIEKFVDDPAVPPYVDEDGVEWPSQVHLEAYKGEPGWIEAVA